MKTSVVIKFAGDSGDGIQLAGGLFTLDTLLSGHNIATLPDFPAEIRAPAGTRAGVSGYQLQFGAEGIHTAGDSYDVLVAMNAAALANNLEGLSKSGVLLVNTAGFGPKNIKLAGVDTDWLEQLEEQGYRILRYDIHELTLESLADSTLDKKAKLRCKNMFALGLIAWLFARETDRFVNEIRRKVKNIELAEANIKVLNAGFYLGEHVEELHKFDTVSKASFDGGTYRRVNGNEAFGLGLIAATHLAERKLFYGSYPITPASDLLHFLARHKQAGVVTFQAEDEIAAVGAAIGASYGGSVGVCATSGPGMVLKGEAIGLAVMAELPLVVCDVQRAGPSTGMPTKTEQSDFNLALHGRNGESPVPVIAPNSPSDSFHCGVEAIRIAVEFMTPVIVLSDATMANGTEPWKVKRIEELPKIQKAKPNPASFNEPYQRNEELARPWVEPGIEKGQHRIGGLEKEENTGAVSYDPGNHQRMVNLRQSKVEGITMNNAWEIENGEESASNILLSWGSSTGPSRAASEKLLENKFDICHVSVRQLFPFPTDLRDLMGRAKKVFIAEMNLGQLADQLDILLDSKVSRVNKVQGVPFTKEEIYNPVKEILNG